VEDEAGGDGSASIEVLEAPWRKEWEMGSLDPFAYIGDRFECGHLDDVIRPSLGSESD